MMRAKEGELLKTHGLVSSSDAPDSNGVLVLKVEWEPDPVQMSPKMNSPVRNAGPKAIKSPRGGKRGTLGNNRGLSDKEVCEVVVGVGWEVVVGVGCEVVGEG
jgi:hypothetical protein